MEHGFTVILVLSVLSAVTMILLVALERTEAKNRGKILDQRLLETKKELRRLRLEMRKKGDTGA